jgi:alpha-acetolactate decarboxylase
MIGWHLQVASEDRARGGHLLGFTLRVGVARLDDATELHVSCARPSSFTARRCSISGAAKPRDGLMTGILAAGSLLPAALLSGV